MPSEEKRTMRQYKQLKHLLMALEILPKVKVVWVVHSAVTDFMMLHVVAYWLGRVQV